MPKCTHTQELWGPHEGCREFMDGPELLECSNYAVFRVDVRAQGPDGPYNSTEYACPSHEPDAVHLLADPFVLSVHITDLLCISTN